MVSNDSSTLVLLILRKISQSIKLLKWNPVNVLLCFKYSAAIAPPCGWSQVFDWRLKLVQLCHYRAATTDWKYNSVFKMSSWTRLYSLFSLLKSELIFKWGLFRITNISNAVNCEEMRPGREQTWNETGHMVQTCCNSAKVTNQWCWNFPPAASLACFQVQTCFQLSVDQLVKSTANSLPDLRAAATTTAHRAVEAFSIWPACFLGSALWFNEIIFFFDGSSSSWTNSWKAVTFH